LPADRVLVDTSVWIEYLRKPSYPSGITLRHWLELGQACSTGLILGELLQGSKGSRDEEAVELLIAATQSLNPNLETWRQAGRLSARLRKKGITIPLFDCLLAALAVENKVSLFSLDGHFGVITAHFPLELAR